ncbi:MAG: TlpA family protein disulfide reductase, partial [Tannerellaceae bacterium]
KLRDLNAAVRRGVPAPDLTMVDLQGKSYKLSDYKGKVVLIDFWFMGCAPCKAEMPYLAQMAKELADKDVVCISLSLDNGDALMEGWRKFIATKGNETLNVNLPGGFTSQECKNYLVRGVPRIVIVDKEGKIVDAYAKRPSDPKLKKQLEELL